MQHTIKKVDVIENHINLEPTSDIYLVKTHLDEAVNVMTVLKSQIDSLEAERMRANDQIATLQNDLRESQEELKKSITSLEEVNNATSLAEEFKNTNYATLIKMLFETPKDELIKTLVQQSNASNRTTVKYAMVSIGIGIVISTSLQYYSYHSSIRLKADVQQMIEANRQENAINSSNIAAQTDATFRLLISALPRKTQEKALMDYILGKKELFGNLETVNDVALLYKLFVVNELPSTPHDTFLAALREVVKPSVVPSLQELRSWDDDIVNLFKRATTTLTTTPTIENAPTPSDATFSTYKNIEDKTEYKEWCVISEAKTKKEILDAFSRALVTANKHKDILGAIPKLGSTARKQ